MSPRAARTETRWREQLPEPGLLWIRWSPRPWDGPAGGVWTDLAKSGLGWGRAVGEQNAWARPNGRSLEDLVYLPPVAETDRRRREELARHLAERGTPVLLQLRVGEAQPEIEGVHTVYDLLPELWRRETAPLRQLPRSSTAVWPLIPGVTVGPELIAAGLGELREAGVEAVLGVDLELSPGDRREVVHSHGEQLFDLLFHRRSSAGRRFSRLADAAGLSWWLERPLPAPPVLRVGNRRLAGLLLSIAELWSRLGRPPEQGQSYYRSARWVDDAHYDVEALLREGNLDVVGAIDVASREAMAESLELGRSTILDELRAAWIGEDEGGTAG